MISLHLHQLSKSFGLRKVLKDVSLEHKSGVLGIAGPNGSGKSTLMKCIAGLLRPTGGKVEWMENHELLSTEESRKRLGFAAPYISLYPELSPVENLQFLKKIRKESSGKQELDELLSYVHLEKSADQPFGKLSTGQQQRLRLAAAIFHGPGALLLDEPGSNLDEEGKKLISNILDRFRRAGKPVIIASNDSRELDLCDRVYSVDK